MRGDRARRLLPVFGFTAAALTACDQGFSPPATLQPAGAMAPATQPAALLTQPRAMTSECSLPGYGVRWSSVNTLAQVELQRNTASCSLTLVGRMTFPPGHAVIAASDALLQDAIVDGEDLLAKRVDLIRPEKAYRFFDNTGPWPRATPAEHLITCTLSGIENRPHRVDRLAAHVHVLLAKERLTRDVALPGAGSAGFVEALPNLSVKLEWPDAARRASTPAGPPLAMPGLVPKVAPPVAETETQPPRETLFTLRYRKPGSAAEAYQSRLEAMRPPIVLDFTLLDGRGEEIEIVGNTAHVGTSAVNMGRMEGTIQGAFLLRADQTPATLRLLYIPATDEKIVTVTVRDLVVP
jgi:hypothetical protein